MDSTAQKLIEAYFNGGNAQNERNPDILKSMLEKIIEVVKENDNREIKNQLRFKTGYSDPRNPAR